MLSFERITDFVTTEAFQFYNIVELVTAVILSAQDNLRMPQVKCEKISTDKEVASTWWKDIQPDVPTNEHNQQPKQMVLSVSDAACVLFDKGKLIYDMPSATNFQLKISDYR